MVVHRTTFAEARTLLGVGQARNRSENAVRRTVPFGLYCYSITVVWYALHGHHPSDAADHRARGPWYTTKTDPSFADMLARLRRVIIAARFLPVSPGQPTDAEIQAVHQPWPQAGLQHSLITPAPREQRKSSDDWLRAALGEAAMAAARTDTFLGARYKRLVKRRGHGKALVAVARSMLVIVWHRLSDPDARFQDLGCDYHLWVLDSAARTRGLVRQLQALGRDVTLTAKAA